MRVWDRSVIGRLPVEFFLYPSINKSKLHWVQSWLKLTLLLLRLIRQSCVNFTSSSDFQNCPPTLHIDFSIPPTISHLFSARFVLQSWPQSSLFTKCGKKLGNKKKYKTLQLLRKKPTLEGHGERQGWRLLLNVMRDCMHKSQRQVCVCVYICRKHVYERICMYTRKTYTYDYRCVFMEQKTLSTSLEPQWGMQTNLQSHAIGIKFGKECTTKHHPSAIAASVGDLRAKNQVTQPQTGVCSRAEPHSESTIP